MWLSVSGAATSGTTRVISATEAERLFGFPRDWTNISTATGSREDENKRKNAVGNAFVVPVIARFVVALCFALKPPITTAMHLWEDRRLPAPFHPDVIDGLFGVALVIANDFQDLVQEFDDASSDWAGCHRSKRTQPACSRLHRCHLTTQVP